MYYDTAGNQVREIIDICDCNLTGGCDKCNPDYFKRIEVDIPTIEEIRQITDKLPSLTKILLEDKC